MISNAWVNGHHPPEWQCPRQTLCDSSACPGESRRCPSPAGRRESANRCGCTDRAGQRKRVLFVSAARRRRREAKRGAKPFAPGEYRVAHGAVNRGGPGRLFWEKTVERSIDKLRPAFEKILEVKTQRATRARSCCRGRHARGCRQSSRDRQAEDRSQFVQRLVGGGKPN